MQDRGTQVPLGIVVAVASVALFIYFIHHVIRFIRAPIVVAPAAGRQLREEPRRQQS